MGKRVSFLALTLFIPYNPLHLHVILSREQRIEKMLKKYPWAAGQSEGRRILSLEKTLSCQPSRWIMMVMPPFHQLIYTKCVFYTRLHAWHLTCIISFNPCRFTMTPKEFSQLQKMATSPPLYVKGLTCSFAYPLVHWFPIAYKVYAWNYTYKTLIYSQSNCQCQPPWCRKNVSTSTEMAEQWHPSSWVQTAFFLVFTQCTPDSSYSSWGSKGLAS